MPRTFDHPTPEAGRRRSAILEAASALVTRFLTQHGFRLAEPVDAGFRTCRRGSTGVEITVKLSDPSRAPAAEAAIAGRFGGPDGVDVINVN